MRRRLLILGGTMEARRLAERLAGDRRFEATISLAGRTSSPAALPLPTRIGGFGGAAGLADFLKAEKIDALVVATHPYAARIAENGAAAARATGLPALRLLRPAWQPEAGDDWREFSALGELVAAIGEAPRRAFVAIGRQEVAQFEAAPQHGYVFRSVDPIEPRLRLPEAAYLAGLDATGPDEEAALFARLGIELLVSKNSGGAASFGKIEAARRLGLPVFMLARPAPAGLGTVETIEAVLDWLAHGSAPEERGE